MTATSADLASARAPPLPLHVIPCQNTHRKPLSKHIMDATAAAAAAAAADAESAHLGRDPQFDAVDAETRAVMQSRVNPSVRARERECQVHPLAV